MLPRTWKAPCHIDFELLGEHLVLLGNQGIGQKQDHRRAVPAPPRLDSAAAHVPDYARAWRGPVHGLAAAAGGGPQMRARCRQGGQSARARVRNIPQPRGPGRTHPARKPAWLSPLESFHAGFGNFSCYAISTLDLESECKLLIQLTPELSEDLIVHLIGAFHYLRQSYKSGSLSYPYSPRELIAIVRHMQAYPGDE
ncbi:hypothetical protein EDB86DRAFT_433027 [Lactarius hatsudake]|nr:hypothetical protein EDB86DRAFT_433027 [Lactarius hatsudake]